MARNTTVKKLQIWYNKFQQEVDWVTKGIIKFTMEIWKPSDEKKRKVIDVITVLGGDSTPYLDTELFFNEKREFGTRVYFKEGYKIKYVGANSVHTDSCKKAIIKSQCIRTTELASRTPENENSNLSEAAKKRGRRSKDKRTIYIHEKYANTWREIPLHGMANKLAK